MYSKRVSEKEASIYLSAAALKITPLVIKYDQGEITTTKYTPLIEFPLSDRGKYCDKIIDKVEQLHNLGILWLDPSEDNVVVDTANDQVYLIDFGLSQYMENLTPETENTFIQAKEIEKNEVKFFCGMGPKPDELGIIQKEGKLTLYIETD